MHNVFADAEGTCQSWQKKNHQGIVGVGRWENQTDLEL
jgi:hypothetical protein